MAQVVVTIAPAIVRIAPVGLMPWRSDWEPRSSAWCAAVACTSGAPSGATLTCWLSLPCRHCGYRVLACLCGLCGVVGPNLPPCALPIRVESARAPSQGVFALASRKVLVFAGAVLILRRCVPADLAAKPSLVERHVQPRLTCYGFERFWRVVVRIQSSTGLSPCPRRNMSSAFIGVGSLVVCRSFHIVGAAAHADAQPHRVVMVAVVVVGGLGAFMRKHVAWALSVWFVAVSSGLGSWRSMCDRRSCFACGASPCSQRAPCPLLACVACRNPAGRESQQRFDTCIAAALPPTASTPLAVVIFHQAATSDLPMYLTGFV